MTENDVKEALQLMAKDAQERGRRDFEGETASADALLSALVGLNGQHGWMITKSQERADLFYIYRPSTPGIRTSPRTADATLRYGDGAFFMQKAGEGNEEKRLPVEFDLYTRTFVGPPDENSPTGRRSALGCIINEVIGGGFAFA